MMRMQVRRQCALLLVIALLLSLSVSVSAAPVAAPVSLSASASPMHMDKVQISVMATQAGVIAEGKLTISYDAQTLRYDGAAAGSAWPAGSDLAMVVNDRQPGKLIVTFAGVHEAAAKDLIVLNFTALKEGTTEVTLDKGQVSFAGTVSGKATLKIGCPSTGFKDVDTSKWYHDGVDYALVKGYMSGSGADTFAPNTTMTRAMLIQVLYKMAGSPAATGTIPFTDVSSGRYYYNALVWAYNNGIASGVSATKFNPNGSVTREQVAVYLFKLAGALGCDTSVNGNLGDFTDAGTIGAYAKDAMSWAVGHGLISGVTATELQPRATTTRAQISVMLMRFDELRTN